MPLPSKEDIASEVALLKEIQAGHVDAMRRSGLLGRALEATGLPEEGTINPQLFRINVRDASGQAVQRIELRLTSTDERGVVHPRHVPITEALGSLTLPVEPFTPDDAAAAEAMVSGLELDRDFGLLSHLSPSMDHIINPYTGMTLAPPPDPTTQKDS